MNREKRHNALVGIDAAPLIRRAQTELRAQFLAGKRREEVDGKPSDDLVLDVPVLLFENPNGSWRAEIMQTFYQGQRENWSVTDANERLVLAELRYSVAERLFADRFCGRESALKYAKVAKINVHGRIPFHRIVSR